MAIVIASYNGADTLGSCLDALATQHAADACEVVVVDDGSSDATYDIARSRGVSVVRHDTNRGISEARNTGIRATTAPIVAFTDDDCIPPPEWSALLLDAWDAADESIQAIGGIAVAAAVDTFNQRYLAVSSPVSPLDAELTQGSGLVFRLGAYLRAAARPPMTGGGRTVYSLVGANMSYRRSALDAIGLFNPDITFGGDEEYVCREIAARFGDEVIWCDPSIVIGHSFDAKLRDSFRRARAYGRGAGRKFVDEGGLPSIRPGAPLAASAAAVALPIGPVAAVAAASAVVLTIFRRWVVDAVRDRQPEQLLYPFVAMAEEITADVGFAEGWWRRRRARG